MNLKSAPVTILLGVVGLVLLTALGWVALIGPAVGAIGEADDAHIEAEDRNAAMSVQLSKLRQQAEDLPRTQLLAKKLDTMFPPTADQPGFFAQVKDAVAKTGIDPNDVTALTLGVPVVFDPSADTSVAAEPAEGDEAPKPEVGDVAVQTVSVGAEGSYEELSELMGHLETMDRAFLIGSVDLTLGSETDTDLTMTVTGAMYVAPPLGDPPSGKR